MNRMRWAIVLLTMPLWLGLGITVWAQNPLYILIPCGSGVLIIVLLMGGLIYEAELRTRADWDLVIRSILHRLGFQVAPPASLSHEIDLSDSTHWHNHTHPHPEAPSSNEDDEA